MRKANSLSGILLYLFLASWSDGAELRTYSFIDETPAYRFSCGECSGPPYWVRAKVEGQFDVRLDFDTRVGTLLSLEARLTRAEGNFGPGIWQEIAWYRDFLSPDGQEDRYLPPYNGTLSPAEYRPLGPGTLTAEHIAPYIGLPGPEIPEEIAYWLELRVGFELAPADSWILSFDGFLPSPDGLKTFVVSSFNIYFEGDEALFSYHVPIADAVSSIAAARAILTPEPAGLGMVCTALILFAVARTTRHWTVVRRRCRLQ